MDIHKGKLEDVTRYLERHDQIPLEDMEVNFKQIMNRITLFKTIDRNTKILEVGIGTGGSPSSARKRGSVAKVSK